MLERPPRGNWRICVSEDLSEAVKQMFAGSKAAIVCCIMMKEVGLDDLQQVYQFNFCDSV